MKRSWFVSYSWIYKQGKQSGYGRLNTTITSFFPKKLSWENLEWLEKEIADEIKEKHGFDELPKVIILSICPIGKVI